jgi:hypothetical protein
MTCAIERVGQKRSEAVKTWLWRRILKISRKDEIRNKEVKRRAFEENVISNAL